jgi:hypothetical protein
MSNEYLDIAMEKVIKQEVSAVLDKIKVELDAARFVDKDTRLCKNVNASGLEVAMQIIDKYKAESEDR